MLRKLEADTQTYMNPLSVQHLFLCLRDSLVENLIFAFLLLINSMPTCRNRPLCTATVAFHVLQSCWGRLDCPYDVPKQTNCQTPPSCVSVLCMWQGKGNRRAAPTETCKSKGMKHEIFMTVYPQQSLQQSLSQPVMLLCEKHSQVSGKLVTHADGSWQHCKLVCTSWF